MEVNRRTTILTLTEEEKNKLVPALEVFEEINTLLAPEENFEDENFPTKESVVYLLAHLTEKGEIEVDEF